MMLWNLHPAIIEIVHIMVATKVPQDYFPSYEEYTDLYYVYEDAPDHEYRILDWERWI